MTEEGIISFNGIDAVTGNYLTAPLSLADAAALVKGQPRDQAEENRLSGLAQALTTPNLGLPLNVRREDVKQAGWAIVFHTGEDQAVKDELQPLIDHRKQQIGNDALVKVLEYKTGETLEQWLGRHGVSAGSVKPKRVPYYVLLIGAPTPERIPFAFGHLLDIEYAVGRLCFDKPEGYAAYVASLIAYEKSAAVPTARELAFFATTHDLDPSTRTSTQDLVRPLLEGVVAEEIEPLADMFGFATPAARRFIGSAATQQALRGLLAPGQQVQPPTILFTASHGLAWPSGHAKQRAEQGALMCQDWAGPGNPPIVGDYLAAGHVPADARLHGTVALFYACYGAGTPSHDRFFHAAAQPAQIAPEPFFAALPQRLLAHPGGGALACISHVERTFSSSIRPPLSGRQLQPFQNMIGHILLGNPVGLALSDFNERYAVQSASLSGLLETQRFAPQTVSDEDLVTRWLLRNDAEGFVLLGDPAVQVRVRDMAGG